MMISIGGSAAAKISSRGFSVASFTDAGHTERPEHTDERLALKIVILGDQEMKFSIFMWNSVLQPLDLPR